MNCLETLASRIDSITDPLVFKFIRSLASRLQQFLFFDLRLIRLAYFLRRLVMDLVSDLIEVDM